MYLKAIEVQGFKSFAQKIVFQFHDGITGIVGPNGSGKSNVADAVRWVLGEQSARQLRSSNMQDVIFSGTENRKPLGYASVAITFDNSDHTLSIEYEEVTVSRRVYRSGESEYKINGNICRLKDIQELFYDTGIGKEGYSIIGQGQIDKILSGRPEDRRELFDEAAGIVKFKKRKNIAVKKLENEKQNLIRVNDILSELEKQTGPLEKQAEKAREYLKLKEEKKSYDVNLFLLESAVLKEKLEKTEENTFIVEGDLLNARQEAESLRVRYDMLTSETEQLDSVIAETKAKVQEANIAAESMEGRIGVLKEQINTEKQNDEHIKGRMAAIFEALNTHEGEKAEFVAQKAALNEQLDALDDKQGELKEKLEDQEDTIREIQFEISSNQEAIMEALNEKANLGANQQRYITMLEQSTTRKSEIAARLLQVKTEEEQQANTLAKLQKNEAAMVEKEKELLTDCDKNRRGIEASKSEEERLSRLLFSRRQESQSLSARLDSLKNLAERYEGYGGSIRRIMENKPKTPGIIGVVADLIHVEKRFEAAIETALGGTIQNIVTDTDTTAKNLIGYLKKNKFGRATFLPLSNLNSRGEFPQKDALKEAGVLGPADALVQVEEELKGLARYLLGKILVVDTIDNGLAIAKKYHHSFRIVTLEGDLLSTGGAMTGGAYKNASNLLGRKRELEELEASVEKAVKLCEETDGTLKKKQKELEALLKEQEDLRTRLQECRLELQAAGMSTAQAKERLKSITLGNEDLLLENKQLMEQMQDIKNSKARLDEEARLLEEKNTSRNKEILALEHRLLVEQRKKEDLSKSHADAAMEFSKLSEQDRFILENILRITREMEKLNEEKDGLENGAVRSKALAEEKSQEIDRVQREIEDKREEIKNLEADITAKEAQKETIAGEQKEFFRKREAQSERIGNLDKESFRLSQQKEKFEEQLDGHVSYLWTEYEMTPSEAGALKNEAYSNISDMKSHINTLKNQIKALGSVNVNAIEDFKEVLERYTFMKTQHDDLVRAEESLNQVIEELEKGMRRQFEEKFQEIKLEFDRVFKELFGGGRGTLELVEGEDLLEAGIAIIAQPPGKKLQNMMQLSGGEKALTAISLLFAIQNLKPSPFCLLDEIEAALDDPNVSRFANYLGKLKKNTQFIVITHRRGTMLIADQLYGITMQEKGVSSLVSVDLTDQAV